MGKSKSSGNLLENEDISTVPKSSIFIGSVTLYAFATAFDFVAVVPGVSIARLVAFLVLFAAVLSVRVARLTLDRLAVILLAFVAITISSMLLNPDAPEKVSATTSTVLNLVLVFVCSMFVCREDDAQRWCKALVWGSLVLTVLMIFSPAAVGTEETGRIVAGIGSSQQDANEFCGYLIVATSYFTYHMLYSRRFSYALPLGAIMYAALMTGSRGGLIALLVTVVIAALSALRSSVHRLRYMLMATILGIAMAVSFNWVLRYLPSSVAVRFEDFSVGGTANQRVKAWEDVLQSYWSDSSAVQLFVGHGFGATTEVTFNGLVAHNLFIELLYSTGVLGLACFLALVAIAFSRFRRAGDWVLISATLGFLALFMSLSALTLKAFWVLLMVAVVKRMGLMSEAPMGSARNGNGT